jgi:hypothetical protein
LCLATPPDTSVVDVATIGCLDVATQSQMS